MDVFSFLSQHPGGELVTLTVAGEDATAEYHMMHLPCVVEKYGSDVIIGTVRSGNANEAMGAAKSSLLAASVRCGVVANLGAKGDWKMEAYDDGACW